MKTLPDIPTVTLPLSKSIAARALVANCLAGGEGLIRELPDCDDSRVIDRAIGEIERSRHQGRLTIHLHANGTALRFMTALAAATEGAEVVLTGIPRLCQRPVGPLLDALRSLGAEISCLEKDGFAPLLVKGRRLDGGSTMLDPSASSQYTSALMLIAPTCSQGITICFTKPQVSQGYVVMTRRMLEDFGISCQCDAHSITVKPGKYSMPQHYSIEPDMSAAAFFYEAMWLGVPVGIAGVPEALRTLPELSNVAMARKAAEKMLQPDAMFAPMLAGAWGREEVSLDLSDTPDIVPSLSIALALADIRFRFNGVGHLRHKECDRISAIEEGLRALGYTLTDKPDALIWDGSRCPAQPLPRIVTHADHRMVMAFAIASAQCGPIVVEDPQSVDKSFPGFWEVIEKIGYSFSPFENGMKVEYPNPKPLTP